MTVQVGKASGSYSDLTVVVPTLNEEQALPVLLDGLAERYPGAHVIVADDDSRDGTRRIAEAFEGPLTVRVVHRNGGSVKGLTASVVDALKVVETAHFIVMDADSQHPVDAVRDVYEAASNGADLAVACRTNYEHFSPARLAFSKGARSLTRGYLRSKRKPLVEDPMSGFFGGKTRFARAVVDAHEDRFEKPGFKVLVDLLRFAPADAVVHEVPYRMGSRTRGESKLRLAHFASLLRQLGPLGKLAAYGLLSFTSPTFWKFAAVGLSGVAVNMGMLYALHEFGGLRIRYSTMLAIEAAIAWNFFWNDRWSFREKGRGIPWAHRFVRWNLHCGVGAVSNAIILVVLVEFVHVHYLLANLAGIGSAMLWNWALSHAWTWRVDVDAKA